MAQRKFIQIYSFGSGVDFTPVVASLQAYILLKIKLIHRPLYFSVTARIAEPSHYFIFMNLSKIRGIICMQLNFDKRAMR